MGETEALTRMTDPLAPAPPPVPTPGSSGASGLVYADVPNRAIAYIIDSIIVFIAILVVGIVLAAVGLATSTVTSALVTETNYVATIIVGLIGIAISGAYFVYTWTTMRATIGMRILGMQIGNAGDGRTLTMEQAIRRFAALSAPSVVAQVFQPVPGLGLLLSLLALGWVIYLLYTTANSPTKQGWHDKFANTQVVKAAKSV
jgi:uncharacterized RDD family membrane protein YckC